ncbi:MAG TPA: hypothetical protein VNW30_09180 [Opitutaceae bacterium]|jgi:hypothetical protein|nr:hypothetical protein [Opitutaceae bacterium]
MNTDAPDLSLFNKHLGEAPFLAGADEGRWGLLDGEELNDWPYCKLWIKCDPAFYPSGMLVLRFHLDNYPASAPTAQPWQPLTNAPLGAGEWPKGAGNVSKVFNPGWNASALYAPCDRLAMVGHDAWKQVFPQWWWTPEYTIVQYLTFIYRVLNPTRHE